MSIVKAENLSFSYGDNHIFKDVNFEIKPGEFIGIIGPNGGGKTTLLQILMGVLSSYQGKVKLFGKKPGKYPHRIAYLSQNLNYDPKLPITVQEVVQMGCLGHSFFGNYKRDDQKLTYEAMKSVNIEDQMYRQFSSLSGGQRQRVLIARALTCHPDLLILDEPAAGIDTHNEEVLQKLLKKLSKTMTIIMVSHHYNLVSKLVTKVLCVNKGVDTHYPQSFDGQTLSELISSNYKYVEHSHD